MINKNKKIKKFKICFAKEEIAKEVEEERMDAFYDLGHSFPVDGPSEWAKQELKKRYGANVEFLSAADVGNTVCVVKFLKVVKKKVLYTTEEEVEIKKGDKIDKCAKKVLSAKYGAEVEFIKAEVV